MSADDAGRVEDAELPVKTVQLATVLLKTAQEWATENCPAVKPGEPSGFYQDQILSILLGAFNINLKSLLQAAEVLSARNQEKP